MKTFFLTSMIVVFLVLCTNGIQVQTTQTKLNQVELMKQFVGSWECKIAKDTTCFFNIMPYGTGLECNFKYVTKGKTVMEGKQLWGYDKKADKYMVSFLVKGTDMKLFSLWFTTKGKYIEIPYGNISDPEKAALKFEGEFKSPDRAVETTFVNNKPIKTDTYTLVKK